MTSRLRALFLGLRSARPSRAAGPTALATIYEREGRYFIEASDRTRWKEAGFWVSSSHVRTLEVAVSDDVLGEALRSALASSRVEVPVPPRNAKLEDALFRAMGVRSRRAAMTGTRACIVTSESTHGDLRIEPQRNGGSSGEERGYRPIAEAALVLPGSSSATEVGRGVRSALARATTSGKS